MKTLQADLRYTEDPHEYLWRGTPVPYTSGILRDLAISDSFEGVSQTRLKRKSNIGRAVHRAIEIILNGKTIREGTIDPAVTPYLEAFKNFTRDSRAEVIHSELALYSEFWGFGTCIDFVGWLNDERVLIDYKTQAVVSKSVEHQLMAQELAWREINREYPIARRFSLQLRPDETYRLKDWTFKPAVEFGKLVTDWAEKRHKGEPCHV